MVEHRLDELFQALGHPTRRAMLAGLSEGGFVMMPLSPEYGFLAKYAWLSDRFGVSWRLSLRLGFDGGR